MKQRLNKIRLFSIDNAGYLRFLKILFIVTPALFVLLLELIRHSIFKEAPPMLPGSLLLAAIVLVATFFFSRTVFANIEQLHHENTRRVRELEVLNDVYQSLDEFHNLNTLLNQAMEKLIQIASADFGEFYVVGEQSGELVHQIHGGLFGDPSMRESELEFREHLLNQGDNLNQHVLMKNAKDIKDGPLAFLAEEGIRSFAAVPIKSTGGTVGIVCLFSKKAERFKKKDAGLLLKVGNRIALAIEKVRLYEKVQALAVLEERERISSELHDGLAQVLGYVITKSQATRQLLRKITDANDYLVELEDVAQDLYTDTREAILGLRTAASGDRGMVSALKEYTARFNQMHGIKTEIMVGEYPIPSLSPQIELQAIRITQEALSNARKHAGATHVSITLNAKGDEVTISVEDNGRGFDLEATKDDWTKFGLRNMQERAKSIHSNLQIESTLEKGTRVTLCIPLTFSQPVLKESRR